MTVNAANGNLPIVLADIASDTANLNHFFQHLHQAFHNLENHWGPYPWDRVGYCIVPFSAGAMEHTTNISFGNIFFSSDASHGEQDMAHRD